MEVQASKYTKPSAEMTMGSNEQELPPKRESSSKKVHFSDVDLERRNLSASNYNMQPVGFKPESNPAPVVQTAAEPKQEIKTSQFTPAPMSKRAPPPPSKPNGITQVARPKFRATANPVRYIILYLQYVDSI